MVWENIPVITTLPSPSTATSCGRSCAIGIRYSRTFGDPRGGIGVTVARVASVIHRASHCAVEAGSRTAEITGKFEVAPA
jgi:hypothetical protein